MLYLADTNIILRLAEPSHPMHADTLAGLAVLRSKGDIGCIIPQNIIEFWNVATRPAKYNGLGFSQLQTQAEVQKVESLFQIVFDAPGIYAEWKRLVIAHAVEGKEVHDARIVAAMHVHKISQLSTFNTDDFKRFTNITAVSPVELQRN
ncbi:MAG: PIN domain-containing protein [Acidobacteria bacterium]|nr:PIN domain-containing protein [Acidobacteriota bacterium]